MKRNVYLTTTLPYVNSDPHIGFALEIVHADIIARYHRFLQKEVFFNTGTDEHGLKIYRKAQEEGKDTQAYVDEYAAKFERLKDALDLSYDNFIRTTDPAHQSAAQEFWKRCDANGDIYKKMYKIKYCVGCELEKTESELENDRCPLHPTFPLETIEEENYFFRFSKYQEPLLKLYEERPSFVIPSFRFNEIKAFVRRGLEDFSISRLTKKMPWGTPVPDDPDHVMFVWFDALVNYVSAIGWSSDMEKFEKWWPVVQFAGKDQIRQQAAMWQAMLMSVGIEPSKQIVIHGFITSGGQKMSKSFGNVINPFDIVSEYGTDALRYYLARHVHPFEDSDFTPEKFKEVYNANLANGLGNLVARIMKMAESYEVSFIQKPIKMKENVYLNNYQINLYMDTIWNKIQHLDEYIQKEEPYKKIKIDKEGAIKNIEYLLSHLDLIIEDLKRVLPKTAEKIQIAIRENKMPETLFPRKG